MRDLPHICREPKKTKGTKKKLSEYGHFIQRWGGRNTQILKWLKERPNLWSTFQWDRVITFLDDVQEKLSGKKKQGKNSQQGSRDRNEHPAGADVTNLGGETVPLWCHMGPILQIFVLEPVLWKVEQVLPSLAFLRRSVTNKCDV